MLVPPLATAGTATLGEATHIAKSPNSQQLAVGYSDGCIRLWDLRSGDCVVTLKGHKSAVTALRYNQSGALLGSGSKDTDIIVWDVAGEAGLYRLRGHKDQVTDLVRRAKGRAQRFRPCLVTLQCNSSHSPAVLPSFCAHQQYPSLSLLQVFVSRANRLVSCSKDSYVKVWDLDTQHCSQTLTGHKGEVWSLDLDLQERRLVTGKELNEI